MASLQFRLPVSFPLVHWSDSGEPDEDGTWNGIHMQHDIASGPTADRGTTISGPTQRQLMTKSGPTCGFGVQKVGPPSAAEWQ